MTDATTTASTSDASTTTASTSDASTTSETMSGSAGESDSTTTGVDTTSTTSTTSTTDSDSETATTGVEAFCGDGSVDPGEECDDGNQVDTDSCTNACTDAACGDGIVGPGEACDDGNQVDDDECTNTCALASCGDGLVQPGEECDDGNDVETDACLNSCLNAKCGDGVVWAEMEECDDANADETDACTSLCKAPTCEDAAQNADETDVDCGGSCEPCGAGKACGDGGDCASLYCDNALCATPPTCKALHASNPDAPSGVYSLDPDGDGGDAPFNAYCDMVTEDGGWTLALKADGTMATFNYNSTFWTNALLHQPQFPGLDRNEAKLQTWNSVPFTEMLVGMEQPIGNMGDLSLKYIKLAVERPSLFALFSPGAYVATNAGRAAWKALITNSSLQPNCNREGFNNAPRTRLGIFSNQENDCNSPDSYIGIGNLNGGCNSVPEARVGNMASCSPDNGDKSLVGFGVVFVR